MLFSSGQDRVAPPARGLAHAHQEYLYDPHGGDRYRHYVASLLCSILSIVFFLLMAVFNFTLGDYVATTVLLACIFSCLICSLLQLASGKSPVPAWLLCSTHILLTWYLLGKGGANMGSVLWSLAYPQAFMLWLGLAQGAALSLFFLASAVALTLSPLSHILPGSFAPESSLRYCITLGGLCLFAFLSEYTRSRLQKKLLYLNRQMKNTALTDPLTRLGNRLAFEQHLKSEYARFLRHGGEFCLIMGDIDHFKNINDRKGHAVGDAVLQHTAEVLSANLRKQDAIFRWGGEEFVIVLTGLPQRELANVAENLRQTVAETPCPYQDEKIYYTMSFGAYNCNLLENAAQAMEKTDQLLYAAKRAGRNRVMTSDNPY